MSAGKAAVGDPESSLGFVESREQIVMTTFGIESGQFTLREVGDSLAITVEGVGDDGEFGGD